MKPFFEHMTRSVSEWSPNLNIHDIDLFRPGFGLEIRGRMDAVDWIPAGSCIKLETIAFNEDERRFLIYPARIGRG